MASYYSPGEREKDNALSSMLAWAQYQKTQGKNFFGQELKVDPSKGKGTGAQTTVTKAKKMPTRLGPAGGRGSQLVQNKRLAQEALKADLGNTVKAASEVGATGLQGLQQKLSGLFERGSAEKLGMSFDAAHSGATLGAKIPEVTTAAQQQIAQQTAKVGQKVASTTGNAMKIASQGTAATGTAATGLQAAASTAMPYLLAAQLVLGMLGSKKDEEGWLGIRPMGSPWGAAGSGGTGVVG